MALRTSWRRRVAEDLLVEIGTEEIPARCMDPAMEGLGGLARESLSRLRLGHGGIHVWGTPRRLTLLVEAVAEVQEDLDQEIMGPPYNKAFDEGGKPTAAAIGFAKAHGVEVSDLKTVETPRGQYLVARKISRGRETKELLSKEIPQWITGLTFPKSMRWRDLNLRFVRPIHWVVAMLGEQVVPFTLDGISSDKITRGHRFLSPQTVEIKGPHRYKDLCRAIFVVVDPKERREMILTEARRAAQGLGGRLVEDPVLLDTVVHLVEYPVVVAGDFEGDFLSLPKEVLVTVMREHQKFFSVEDDRGRLLPHFVNVSNIRNDSMELIRKGNERVLRARLRDARFFFEEDQKRPLGDKVRELEGVIFHSKLGTLSEKVQRLESLAYALAQELEPEVTREVQRAARLCKCDLTTEMVREFPTLQGVMGKEYASLQGETPEVAVAIEEHYLPTFSGDRLPSTRVGAVLALADKLDTVCGCFGVGEVPTGAGDPLGLRRAALGVLQILFDRGYQISLRSMVRKALGFLGDKVCLPQDRIEEDVLEFFRVRLENLWTGQGRSAEAVMAVISAGFDNLPEARCRLAALESFMGEDGFEDLALSFKRVLNIVGDHGPGEVEHSLVRQPEEEDLLGLVRWAEAQIQDRLERGEHLEALRDLAGQRARVDRFFDAVLVNDPDPRVRGNRLNMLARLASVFLRIADFSRLSGRG